jgi:chemotaxis methyl-accepting protein methylase
MSESILNSVSRVGFVRRYAGKPFLRVNEWGWNRLPSALKSVRPIRQYGAFLHSLVKLQSSRRQYHGTFFLRNRPELELIRALAEKRPQASTLKIAVVACSNGAEVYSIVWTIRSARPDLKLVVHAMDISKEIVEIAKEGVYSEESEKIVSSPIFERLTAEEIRTMFDQDNGRMKIRSWIREGINWRVGDAGDPQLGNNLGPQDIVVANKFLCHMGPPDAERCLRNIAQLVAPGGYLVVSGIDLEVRTKVALQLGWAPIPELIEEIHDGDPSVRRDWPWKYWGLEPFDQKKRDWVVRYASFFQLGKPSTQDENVSQSRTGQTLLR